MAHTFYFLSKESLLLCLKMVQYEPLDKSACKKFLRYNNPNKGP